MKSSVKFSFTWLLLCQVCSTVMAQQKSKVKQAAVFHSFNSVQLLNGNTTTAVALHSVNGLQWNKFFAGIGTGFDYYYHTTVPLFAEARYDVTGSSRKLQVFVNAGIHFPFSTLNKKFEYKTGDYKTGRLLAAGIDYFIPVKKDALVIGVAYSHKQVIQMIDNNIWNPVLNRVDNIPIKDDYKLNRIWIKFGWVF
jgi:hypothetical protein